MGRTVFDKRKGTKGKPKVKDTARPTHQDSFVPEPTTAEVFPSAPDQTPSVSQSVEVLQQRNQARKNLPEPVLHGQTLLYGGAKPRNASWDFRPLIAAYPHHELLIHQLVVGAFPPPMTISWTTFGRSEESIETFLHFLNEPGAVHNTQVSQVADINVSVCSSFVQYFYRRFPKRVTNRSIYGAFRRIVQGLQQKYSHDLRIGQALEWPQGPSSGHSVVEGYSALVYTELIHACRKDIIDTKRLHQLWADAATGEKLAAHADFSLPNIMHLLKQYDHPAMKRGPNIAIRRKMKTLVKRFDINGRKCTAVEVFLLREGLSLEEATQRYGPANDGRDVPEKRDWPPKGEWTPEDFTYWLHRTLFNDCVPRKRPFSQLLKLVIRKVPLLAPALAAHGLSVEQLAEMYEAQGDELAAQGHSPFITSVCQSDNRLDEPLETFKATLASLRQDFPDYPFDMSADEASEFISQERYRTLTKAGHATDEAILLSVIEINRTDAFYGGKLDRKSLIKASYHFLPSTLYPFLLHVQLNTGWNLETVLAITENIDDHIEPDILLPDDYVMVYSTKVKGQSARPHGTKVMKHRCSRKKPFSTYQLLKYVESIIKRYHGHTEFHEGHLWQYTTGLFQKKKTHLNTWIASEDILPEAPGAFLARHLFKHFVQLGKDGKPVLDDNGYPKSSAGIDHRKVRSAYETVREVQSIPSAIISEDMGHEDQATTQDYYASDTQSNRVKDLKIAPLQDKLLADMRDYDCRIEQDVKLQDLRDAILDSRATAAQKEERLKAAAEATGIKPEKIVHMIQPDNKPYIAACQDNLTPTWPGWQDYLKQGQPCNYFNKCVLCKQGVIFSETLPYIARRLLDLDEMRAEMNQAEWSSSFSEECDGWQAVLDTWEDQEQVAEARISAERGDVVLPNRMRGAR